MKLSYILLISLAFAVLSITSSTVEEPKTNFTISGIDPEFGAQIASAGDVNGDGYADILINSKGSRHVYVLYGGPTASLNNFDISDWTPKQGFFITTPFYDVKSLNAVDLNKDGFSDLIIAAERSFDSLETIFIIYGGAKLSDMNINNIKPTQGFAITGLNKSWPNFKASAAGDINGDGIQDLIIGSISGNKISAYVLYGSKTPSGLDLRKLDKKQGFEITSNQFLPADYDLTLREVMSVGDVNKDGFADVAIASSWKNGGGYVHVVYGGKTLGNLNIATMTLSQGFNVTSEKGHIGSISSAGDFNKDGFADIILGTQGYGTAFILFGGKSLESFDLKQEWNDKRGIAIKGDRNLFFFSDRVAYAGDFNNDGFDDVAIVASGRKETPVFVFYGSSSPSNITTDKMTPQQGFGFKYPSGDHVDSHLTLAGDINKDGYSDLIMRESDLNHRDNSKIHVVFGRKTA